MISSFNAIFQLLIVSNFSISWLVPRIASLILIRASTTSETWSINEALIDSKCFASEMSHLTMFPRFPFRSVLEDYNTSTLENFPKLFLFMFELKRAVSTIYARYLLVYETMSWESLIGQLFNQHSLCVPSHGGHLLSPFSWAIKIATTKASLEMARARHAGWNRLFR